MNQALINYQNLSREKQIEVEQKGLCADLSIVITPRNEIRIKIQGFPKLVAPIRQLLDGLYKAGFQSVADLDRMLVWNPFYGHLWVNLADKQRKRFIFEVIKANQPLYEITI
jgi:hypothetical protein